MSLRRVGVLLGKEFVRGPRNFMFIFALVVPIVFTLVLTLLFGTFFSGKPKLGVADTGNSQLVTEAKAVDSIIVNEYESDEALREAALKLKRTFGAKVCCKIAPFWAPLLPSGFVPLPGRKSRWKLSRRHWGMKRPFPGKIACCPLWCSSP